MPVGATFVGELRAAMEEAGFAIADANFDRRHGFPQLLISYLGLDPARSRIGERVPRAQILVATDYAQSVAPDLNEFAEDVAIRVFDACERLGTVLAFDFGGTTRFEPTDGTQAEYLGLVFQVERSGGVPRG